MRVNTYTSSPPTFYRTVKTRVKHTGFMVVSRANASEFSPISATAGDIIGITVSHSASSGVPVRSNIASNLSPQEPDIDAKLAAMSSVELADEIRSLAGIWADREDMTDDWLDELRADMTAGWAKRLEELYGDELSL